jgi:hypothetical protein
MSAYVSSLSVEAYVALHAALTKGRGAVQAVTPIEEAFYKLGDLRAVGAAATLRKHTVITALVPVTQLTSLATPAMTWPLQLLQIHGCSATKINRAELLRGLRGMALINPVALCAASSTDIDVHIGASACAAAAAGTGAINHAPHVVGLLPVTAADLVALGWFDEGSSVSQDSIQWLPLSERVSQGGASMGQPDAATGRYGVSSAPLDVPTDVEPCAGGVSAASNLVSAWPRMLLEQQQPLVPSSAPAAATCLAAVSAQQELQQQVQQHNMEQQDQEQQDQEQQQQQELQSVPPAIITKQSHLPALAALETASTSSQCMIPTWSQVPQQQPQQQPQQPPCMPSPRARALLQRAELLPPPQLPRHVHSPWLLQQLRRFAASGALPCKSHHPAEGSALCGTSGAQGALLGRSVGFVLLDTMRVDGSRSGGRSLPAGVYAGRAVRYLGSACQPELCEVDCAGGHAHYRARVLPPPPPARGLPAAMGDDEAAAADAAAAIAHAAVSGRPVVLILDLHPRLQCATFTQLLSLSAPQLQARTTAATSLTSPACAAPQVAMSALSLAWMLHTCQSCVACLPNTDDAGCMDASGGARPRRQLGRQQQWRERRRACQPRCAH